MPLNDIGPRGWHQGQAVATLAFTPQYDRAAIVRRILIDKVSAGDVWVVNVQGQELARFDIQIVGNQQPLAGPYSVYPKTNDLFEVFQTEFGEPLIYPVPLGQTMTVSSVGGATGNVQISYVEVNPSEISPGLMNHPQGSRIVTVLTGYRAAPITALGENTLDTQIGPNFFPNLFVDGLLPPNWRIKVLGMFLEGAGVNTFSGAANHASVTNYFAMFRNGQRMFTRDALGGIPLVGQASAAGSANAVIGTDETPLPPFQEADDFDWRAFEQPIMFGGGDTYQMRLSVAGDVTGGANYAAVRQLLLVDVMVG